MSPTLLVYTFKEGLLSRLAHDLQVRLQRFEVEVDAGRVSARFPLDAFRVIGAMKNGRLAEGTLSASDRGKIEHTLREEVLHTARHPEARLTAEVVPDGEGRARLEGTLDLAGHQASIHAALRDDGGITTRIELQPSRWGIAPYRALGGTLRLQDRVVVEVQLPKDVAGFDAAAPFASKASWRAGAV